MKLAIICAMEEELEKIVEIFDSKCEKIKYNNFIVYFFMYKQYEIYLTLSGIGKVNAASTTQYMIDKFAIDYVVNVGVAGSLSDKLQFGDIVVANELIQYDVDVTAFGLIKGQIPRMNVYAFPTECNIIKMKLNNKMKIEYGTIVSGDTFVDNETLALELANNFNAIACEMEGASIAHVCFLNKIPVLVIRSISDFAGRDNKLASHSFKELKEMAAFKSSMFVEHILLHNIL